MGGTDRRVPGGIRDVLMPVVTLHRRMYPPERCRAVVLCALPTRRKVVLVPLPRKHSFRTFRIFCGSLVFIWGTV